MSFAAGRRPGGMTFPIVTEKPLQLEPVDRDTFLGESEEAAATAPATPRRRPLDA